MAFINKVIYGGDVLIDLTADTIEEGKLLDGYTAHDKSGAPITGTCTFDADTSDADALDSEILLGRSGYVGGIKLVGTMPNNGAINGAIDTVDRQYLIPNGFHDGSGYVEIDAVEQAKIIPENIKLGVSVLGVVGTLSPSSKVTVQDKTFTPTKDGDTVLPDVGFDYLTQVVVEPIPYTESQNVAGGLTVTIA